MIYTGYPVYIIYDIYRVPCIYQILIVTDIYRVPCTYPIWYIQGNMYVSRSHPHGIQYVCQSPRACLQILPDQTNLYTRPVSSVNVLPRWNMGENQICIFMTISPKNICIIHICRKIHVFTVSINRTFIETIYYIHIPSGFQNNCRYLACDGYTKQT
jgi:hypothetical protein